MPRALLAAFALLALGCGSAPPPPALHVAEGFEVEVAAGPPLVERPMIVDFDEQGRLYVAESSGSNAPVRAQLEDPTHSILRLEDTDGDGRYDRRTVFADGVMFPEGVLYHDGSVYVAAPPHIWKLTDDDGDGVADRREIWHDGQTLTNCANDLHGPYLGRDGWIYWTKGAFAEQTHALDGGGTLVTKAAHVFRRRPEGGPLETVLTGGMDNPVEVAFSPEGERFLTSTFLEQPSAGRRDGLIHMLYGGVYGKIHGVIDSHAQTGGLQPAMTHLGPAAPVGLSYYESAIFGAEYRGNLFATQFNTRRVSRHRLIPDGATFRTEDSDFLVSDDFDFHPTDVAEDADGSLLVVDTGGWYKLCCPTSQMAKPDVPGAIYRVRRKGAPAVKDSRGAALEWAEADPEALAARLGDPRPFVARRAIGELRRRGATAVPALARLLEDRSASLEARRDAVWTLARIDDPAARAAVRKALADPNASVRQAAAHVAGLWRDAGAAEELLNLLKQDLAPLRRAAAEALGRIGNGRAADPLLAAVSEDFALTHSATYALIEIGDPAPLRAALDSPKPHVRRAALVAMDQMRGGRLDARTVVPLLSSSEPLLRETAAWIAVRHPEWGGELAGYFGRALTGAATEDDRARLERQLAAFTGHPAIQALLARTASDAAASARLSALRAGAARPPKPAPAAWISALERALRATDEPIQRAALAAARALDKDELPKLTPALAALGGSVRASDEVRAAAWALAAPRVPNLDDISFAYLTARLDPERPVAERGAAARALAAAPLTPPQRVALTEALEKAGPMEAPVLLDAFAAGGDEALGLGLVGAVGRARSASSLPPGAVAAVFEKFPENVRAKGRAALAALDSAHAGREAKLAGLAANLAAGDARRGQAVFNSEKAACMACHRVGYAGGRVGPDLTRIGEIRTDRDLLEAVVFPSASFVRGFEPLVVETADDLYNGVVVEEAEAHLLLATGADTQARIERASIEDARPGTVSIMPSGLDEELSRQELADLIAFLKNARWGPN